MENFVSFVLIVLWFAVASDGRWDVALYISMIGVSFGFMRVAYGA